MIHEWQRFDRLEPFNIVELGPGRGSLMSDICRVVSKLGCDQKNTTIHLVEISPYLKQVQVKLLCPQADVEHDNQYILSQSGLPIRWYNHLDEVPICNGFTVYVANEFFDALPIHKFQVPLVFKPFALEIKPLDFVFCRKIPTDTGGRY